MHNKVITPGVEMYFEYHCWESDKSADAQLWYHSHRKVTVLECNNPEYYDACKTAKGRINNGILLAYQVRFSCGCEFEAMEDELFDRESEYRRPDPPKGKCKCKEINHE